MITLIVGFVTNFWKFFANTSLPVKGDHQKSVNDDNYLEREDDDDTTDAKNAIIQAWRKTLNVK